MKTQEIKALEAAAKLYNTLPNYLYGHGDRKTIILLLLDLINALDMIEFNESGKPFFSIFRNAPHDITFERKRSVLAITKEYNLTEREMQILAYLGNARNTTYIAETLNIAKATVKVHKYSIFKKLDIHSLAELKDLFAKFE